MFCGIIRIFFVCRQKYEDIFILRKTQFYKTLEIFYYDPVQLLYLMM